MTVVADGSSPLRLPSTMAQNLSVPLAFVALLHLANEKVSSPVALVSTLLRTQLLPSAAIFVSDRTWSW